MEPWILLASLGIQTLVFLAGGYGMVLRSSWSSMALEKQLASMEDELKKLSTVIINQAVHTNRLDNQGEQLVVLQKEVADLRRGVGWKVDHGRPGIDGEYK